MRRRCALGVCLLVVGGLVSWGQAAFIASEPVAGQRVIVDTTTNLMWMTGTNDVNYGQALVWADALVWGGYEDWRLSTADPPAGIGAVSSGNEMSDLYLKGIHIGNPGAFGYVAHGLFWMQDGWVVSMENGMQNNFAQFNLTNQKLRAWAVREVPEPGGMLLLLAGIPLLKHSRRG